jgi:hypothetical protein
MTGEPMTSNVQAGSSQNFLYLMLAWVLVMIPPTVCGQELFYETEPNNTPAEANTVSGEINIAGTMSGSDQDAFMWTVSDADAEKLWTIRLDGIPGKLTILQVFRVEFADNGVDVVGKQKLFGTGTRDGAKPAIVRDMLFEPGDYVLGFAYGGGSSGYYRPPVDSVAFGEGSGEDAGEQEQGGYRATIRSAPLNVRALPAPPESQGDAPTLRASNLHASFIASETSWYRLELSEEQAENLWEIHGQIPVGQTAVVTLRNVDGAEQASTEVDDFGHFRLTDLGLPAGEHFIEIRGDQPNTIRLVDSTQTGQRIEGGEAEENGDWTLANIVDGLKPVTGRFGVRGDADFFRFTLDEQDVEQLLELTATTGAGQNINLCLLDDLGRRVQCRSGQGTVTLPKLNLQPGEWGVQLDKGIESAEYTWQLSPQGSRNPDLEFEPNDEIERAVTMPARNRIKGRFDTAGDDDYFRFVVTDEAQLWRFQAIGDGLQRITYFDGAGRQGQQFRESSRRLRLENVFLMPGQHFIALAGKPGTDYTLLARPLGPPDPLGEREPNDSISQPQRIEFGQRRNGLLPSTADEDLYSFTLYDWERIRVMAEPAADGDLYMKLYWDYPSYFFRENISPGEPANFEGLFPPGDYIISLTSRKVSDAEYHLGIERLDRFSCPTDCEPNPDQAFASPIPASGIIEGSNDGWDPTDVYELTVADKARQLLVYADQPYQLKVTAANDRENLVAWDPALGAFRGQIPAGAMTYLEIRSANEGYRLAIGWDGSPEPSLAAGKPAAEIELDLDAAAVRAYREYGQRVTGRLRVMNTGASTLAMSLEAATSDRRWQVELEQAAIEVAPGETRKVPLTVNVPRDAWNGFSTRISVRAFNEGGQVTAQGDIHVETEADPVSPVRHFALPDALRGGFNVAKQQLGGSWAGNYTTAVGGRFEQAIDGVAVSGNGMGLRGGYKGDTAELVYDLAGEEPVEVAGVTINLLTGASKRTYLRRLDVAASLDGATWEPLVFAPLEPVDGEQAFVLDHPVKARQVRLRPELNWGGKPRLEEKVGEFKIITPPGFDLSGGKGFNLARRDLGGHVVWHRPHIDAHWGNSILAEEGRDPSVRIKVGQSLSWVIGFHHDRAALLDRLEWVHKPPGHKSVRFKTVQVAASMDSPLGPWTPIGTWKLSADGTVDVFKPEQAFWGRYLKFTTNPVEERLSHALPTPLRAWEVPTSAEYRSVLTEWGDLSRQAFWESRRPVPPDPPFTLAANDSKARAAPLEPFQRVSGAVMLGSHEHWYRLKVPADQNTLTLYLQGRPTVRTVVNAETEAGERLVVRRIDQRSAPYEHVFEAVTEPGAVIYVHVEEPPRSVIFAWDTSPSVAPYVPVIYNALLEYSRDARPGLDAVNFMPFGRGLLLKEWFSEPYVLQTVVNEYPRRESSSLAETTLTKASLQLAPRPGSKAVLLITDAFTPRYRGGLWDALEAVRPRVFGLGVNIVGPGIGDVNHAYDLMQGWTAVNGGHFSQLLTPGELEVGFERAQTLLTEPAAYSLEVKTEFREAPGPGTLTVVAGGDAGQAAGGAVELILDASGSMLKRQQGKRRIAIAREVLTEAVSDWIPDNTPIALRVFGHREPNACRTDLEVSLAPIDRDALAATIAGVQAMNLAKTPIADSLAAAARDLSSAQGSVSILLLTDGEETCEGDPAEAIALLQEKGIDVTLNIVGFAIGDAQTEALFTEWATLGGGRYFSAADQAGLADAVNTALKVPFVVYAQDGSKVTEGLVGGEPAELEAGFYRVVVKGAEPRVFDDVEIAGESRVELELNQAR